MGYYTIRFYPSSQEIMTIVTEFEKFRYNCIPLYMCASVYISQAKVYKLISDIECVNTYISDILFLIRDCFKNHINQLRIIFGRLCAAGLKYNVTK